jgi:uncharacterized protein
MSDGILGPTAASSVPTAAARGNGASSHSRVVEHHFGDLTASTVPLTVFARHKIKAGHEDMFRRWVQEIDLLQRNQYDGYLGVEIVRPTLCGSNEFVSIYRYENYELLQRWMESEDRMQMLDKTNDFEDEPIVISYHSLEYWFVPPNTENDKAQQKQQRPPSREKMAFTTFLCIWFQVRFITPNTIGKIPNIPLWAFQCFGTLLIVLLTTYIFMPLITKYILRWWLFPDPTKRWYCWSTNKEKNNKDHDNDHHHHHSPSTTGLIIAPTTTPIANTSHTTTTTTSTITGTMKMDDEKDEKDDPNLMLNV